MKKLSIILGIVGLMLTIPNGYSYWIGLSATEENLTPIIDEQRTLTRARPNVGEEIGRLTIPSLNFNVPIYYGSSENELKKGVGHYIRSGLPGENRHIVLTGHRDTIFRKLENIKNNEYIWVEMKNGKYQYKINKIKIVSQHDRTILVEKPVETLTLITCYPFQYIGNAPERFIISAKLMKKPTHNEKRLGHN
ncbi:class D sortase [Bacillus suaedaesalsae]|uniref:Class D sortase n=1 Tax=Bacillus suaedaesalsae TaxID=2810349 RepID=A0ABS2DFC3_9BACI|nr:class D sortase [Bacillus suaedaesalsae]MBM6617165.1 class D sortase [Bacillus suaedaesalsae]